MQGMINDDVEGTYTLVEGSRVASSGLFVAPFSRLIRLSVRLTIPLRLRASPRKPPNLVVRTLPGANCSDDWE